MTQRNSGERKTTAGKKKPASPDTLTKGKIELSEDELKDVTGGCVDDKHLTT